MSTNKQILISGQISETVIFLEDCRYKDQKNAFVEFIHQVSSYLFANLKKLLQSTTTKIVEQLSGKVVIYTENSDLTNAGPLLGPH